MELAKEREDDLLTERIKRVITSIGAAVKTVEEICPDSAEKTLAINEANDMKKWAELALRSRPPVNQYDSLEVEEQFRKNVRELSL